MLFIIKYNKEVMTVAEQKVTQRMGTRTSKGKSNDHGDSLIF